jgi:NitT/TauT family transport system permease protein
MASRNGVASREELLGAELSGLDALELGAERKRSPGMRLWASLWPKALAVGIAIGAWQSVVWSGWKPQYVLPGPRSVIAELVSSHAVVWRAVLLTMRRAAGGYALAVSVGIVLGLALSAVPVLRAAIGSLITGLQTMPSIAWFPLAILLFKLSESAILSVVVLGAAPSIANGLISGVDQVPPTLRRAGRAMGAHGRSEYAHVVLPAILPSFVAGLKQGWAFAWRSLIAGELLVVVAGRPSIGARLQFARELSDATALLGWMAVILLIGILIDSLGFGVLERTLRARRGLA